MSGLTGIGTTFNLPNYHGELIQLSPTETPLLSMAGGLSGGGQQTDAKAFEWQTEDLRDPASRPRLEGAAAPAAEARVRANLENVVQIFHETVETSYTKQAATGAYASAVGTSGSANPVINEHVHQVSNALTTIARDINWTMWNGKLVKPADNTTARQMAGILSVAGTTKVKTGSTLLVDASASGDTITKTHSLVVNDKVVFTDVGASTTLVAGRAYWVTSVSTTVSFKVSATKGGTAITVGTATVSAYAIPAANIITTTDADDLFQTVWDLGGLTDQGTATIFVNSGMKRAITKAYASSYQQANPVRETVGGVVVNTLQTDFGVFNIVLDRAVPMDAIAVVSMGLVAPVFLNIPGKGVLFEEELAKVGSSERSQIYGEVGLKYGNPNAHGVIRGLFA